MFPIMRDCPCEQGDYVERADPNFVPKYVMLRGFVNLLSMKHLSEKFSKYVTLWPSMNKLG